MDELSGRLRERVAAGDGTAGDEAWWAQLRPVTAAAVTGSPDLPPAYPRWRVTLRAGRGVDAGTRLWWRGRELAVLSATRDPAAPDRVELLVEERP